MLRTLLIFSAKGYLIPQTDSKWHCKARTSSSTMDHPSIQPALVNVKPYATEQQRPTEIFAGYLISCSALVIRDCFTEGAVVDPCALVKSHDSLHFIPLICTLCGYHEGPLCDSECIYSAGPRPHSQREESSWQLANSCCKNTTSDLVSPPAWCADTDRGLVIRKSLLRSYKQLSDRGHCVCYSQQMCQPTFFHQETAFPTLGLPHSLLPSQRCLHRRVLTPLFPSSLPFLFPFSFFTSAWQGARCTDTTGMTPPIRILSCPDTTVWKAHSAIKQGDV